MENEKIKNENQEENYKQLKRYNIYFCDFETVTPNTNYFKTHKDTKVLYGILLSNKNESYYEFYNILDWWKIILNLKNRWYIFFHNLNYDAQFILSSLKQHKDNFKFKSLSSDLLNEKKIIFKYEKFKRTFYLTYFIQKNNKYYINIRWKHGAIKIMCTLKTLILSVEKLGKIYGIEKYKEGQNNDSFYDIEPEEVFFNEEFKNYCLGDCKIIKKAFNDFYNSVNDVAFYKNQSQEVPLKKFITSAGLSFSLIKNEAFNKSIDELLYISYEDNEKFRHWYSGGFTQFNEKYRFKPLKNINGVSYDINSSYPSVMVTPLPLKEVKYKEHNTTTLLKIEVSKAEIKIEYAGWNLLNPKYSKLKCEDNNYLQNINDPSIFYFYEEELEIIKKFYKKFEYKILETHYFKKYSFCNYIIENLYNLKTEAKKEHKNDLVYKILINSAYGRLALNPNKKLRYESVKKLHLDEIINIEGDDYKVAAIKKENFFNDYYVYEIEQININQTLNVVAAGYITSQARIKLLKALYDNIDNVIYMDTDSLYFKDKDLINYENLEVDNEKLGAWKKEKEYDHMVVLAPKLYATQKNNDAELDIKAKGLSIKLLNKKYFNVNEFLDLMDEVNYSYQLEKYPSGYVINKKPKQFLLNGNKELINKFIKKIREFIKNKYNIIVKYNEIIIISKRKIAAKTYDVKFCYDDNISKLKIKI